MDDFNWPTAAVIVGMFTLVGFIVWTKHGGESVIVCPHCEKAIDLGEAQGPTISIENKATD